MELYHKHKALVPSSLAPVLLPVVGGAANQRASLAAEKLLLKSRIRFHVHHSNQLNFVFKAFCPFNSSLFFCTCGTSLTSLRVAQLCRGSLEVMEWGSAATSSDTPAVLLFLCSVAPKESLLCALHNCLSLVA